MRPAKRSWLKTSGACSNRWHAKWRQVGAVHLNRRRAIEVNRPTLRRQPPRRSHTLDKETTKTRWTLHDRLIPTRPIHFSPNESTTLFWKQSKSPLKVKIAMSAYAN